MTLTKTYPLDPQKQYIFGYHPHGKISFVISTKSSSGIYSFGLFCLCFPKISGWENKFPGIK
jgi:hypothetical protein